MGQRLGIASRAKIRVIRRCCIREDGEKVASSRIERVTAGRNDNRINAKLGAPPRSRACQVKTRGRGGGGGRHLERGRHRYALIMHTRAEGRRRRKGKRKKKENATAFRMNESTARVSAHDSAAI